MKASTPETVCGLYENSADSYAEMMDTEINLPVYRDTLGRLAARIVDLPGALVDTSCGSGHMLLMYRECFDQARELIGIDLSPRMGEIARSRLGSASIQLGDMRDLSGIEEGAAVAVLSFFAIHHIDSNDIVKALQEWSRVLQSGGQLIVAAWEGAGLIDYGETSDVVAHRYSEEQVSNWVLRAGFVVDRCVVEPVEEMDMAAVYLEATKA